MKRKTLLNWHHEQERMAKRKSHRPWALALEVGFAVAVAALLLWPDSHPFEPSSGSDVEEAASLAIEQLGPVLRSENSFFIGRVDNHAASDSEQVKEGIRLQAIRQLDEPENIDTNLANRNEQGSSALLETGQYVFNADAKQPLSMEIGTRISANLYAHGALTFVRHRGRLVPLVHGRADFSVKPGREPVFVLTPRAVVEVVGTKFSVHVHKSENWEKVAVREGKVLYYDRERSFSLALTARQSATWNQEAKKPVVTEEFQQTPSPRSVDERNGTIRKKEHVPHHVSPKRAENPPQSPKQRHVGTPMGAPAKEEVLPADNTTTHATLEIPSVDVAIDKLPELSDDDSSGVFQRRDTGDSKQTQGSWTQNLLTLPPLERHNVERYYDAIETFMKDGYTQRALTSLQEYIDDHPGFVNERAMFLVAECYKSLGDHKKALEAYRHYLKKYPKGSWRIHAKLSIGELE